MLDRVGLACMRLQPLHRGHTRLISRMIEDCGTVIVGIGSSGISKTRSNPFDGDMRKDMVKRVFGDRVKILLLNDLGATDSTSDWADYVVEKIKKIGLPSPTDYYSGSMADALWYRERFYTKGLSPWTEGVPGSAVMHPDNHCYYENGVLKRLHIVDRDSSSIPTASDIRTFIELGNDQWKKWVPNVIHELVEKSYPNEYKVGV